MILRRAGIWEAIVLVGLSGCGEPGEVIPLAPPGAAVSTKVPDNDPAQAQGEMESLAPSTPKPKKVADFPPAPPTAQGETKTTPGGVKYETVKNGSGATLKLGQTVMMHYVGTLENGESFDTTRTTNHPKTFQIGVDPSLQGWEEALPGMKVGEIRKLFIPSALGYGKEGKLPAVPPDANLKFEVELLNIVSDH